MTGEANDWLNKLQGAPIGPSVTLTRNFATVVSAFAGVVCMVVPQLQGVPAASVILGVVAGLVFITASLFTVFRWKPLLARARRSSVATGASGFFPFMHAEFVKADRKTSNFPGSGWVLIFEDRLEAYAKHAGGDGSLGRHAKALPFAEIVGVARRLDTTGLMYGVLEVELVSGEVMRFTLAPRSGSGMRGPRIEEIDAAVRSIRTRFHPFGP